MNSAVSKFLSLLALALSGITACAASDATGVWKWSFTTQNGDVFESVAKLKQEGEKLTGTIDGRFGVAEIQEGSVKADEIKFQVKRERDGQSFLVKYSGKLSGDSITGKTSFEFANGEGRTRDWEAKRQAPKPVVAGNWNSALILPDGNRIEGVLKLQEQGDKLTGAVVRNNNETSIQDGKIQGEEISFTVIRERDGRKVTGKYKAKVAGDTLKGKMESDWSGDWQTLDWEGTRAK